LEVVLGYILYLNIYITLETTGMSQLKKYAL